MEMPTKTKTATRATKTTRAARAKTQARAQALFKTATGNRYSYTRKISTVKMSTELEKILYPAKKYNNKTKIKIKRTTNHLKFLINFYFKLILYISLINKTILKIFNIKDNYTKNNSENYIIKSQKKQQKEKKNIKDEAVYLQKNSFQIVIKFLTNFQYCMRKTLINNVKLKIRHFVGICLKRLISLTRLPQIPVSSKIEKSNEYDGHIKQVIKQMIKKLKRSLKGKLRGREKVSAENSKCKYMQQLETAEKKEDIFRVAKEFLSFSLDIQNERILLHKKGQQEFKKELPSINKQQNWKEQISLKLSLKRKVIFRLSFFNSKLYKLNQSFTEKCSQFSYKMMALVKQNKTRSNEIPKVQSQICTNVWVLPKIFQTFNQKCSQLLAQNKQSLNHAEKAKNTKILEYFKDFWQKCCQLKKFWNQFMSSYGRKNEINNFPISENKNTLQAISQQINKKCCQLKTNFFKQEAQEFVLQTKFTEKLRKIYSLPTKSKFKNKQKFSPNSPQQQNQLQYFKNALLFDNKETYQILDNLRQTVEVNDIVVCKAKKMHKLSLNSPRKCSYINCHVITYQQKKINKNKIMEQFGPKFLFELTNNQVFINMRKTEIIRDITINSPLEKPQIETYHDIKNYTLLKAFYGKTLTKQRQTNFNSTLSGPPGLKRYSPNSTQIKRNTNYDISLEIYNNNFKTSSWLNNSFGVIQNLDYSRDQCCQLNIFNANIHHSFETAYEIKICCATNFLQIDNKRRNHLKQLKNQEIRKFSANSALQCCQFGPKNEVFSSQTEIACEINFFEIVKGSKYKIKDTGKLTANLSNKWCQLLKQKISLSSKILIKSQIRHFKNISKLAKSGEFSKKQSCHFGKNIYKSKIKHQKVFKITKTKTILLLSKQYILNIALQNPGHFTSRTKVAANALQTKELNSLLAASQQTDNFSFTTDKQSTFNQNQQPNFNQKFCIANGLQKQTSNHFINGEKKEEEETKLKLAFQANIIRHFQFADNNNSYQVKSKHQAFLKKCQHILYTILLSSCCFCWYWHINGFPLVLVKIFKYLKDATVHVLTRQLKIITKTTKASICHYCGNNETACDGKLKKPTKVPVYKANQQNVFKRQQAHTLFTMSCGAYESSCCSTISLTTSSSYCKSLKYSTLSHKPAQKQPQAQQQSSTYCRYKQHQHYHYNHHHYQHNRQRSEQTQQQQQQHHQQLYNFNSTIHFQLPSLLVFSRTLIILILLSSLWHTSEGFHGSGVRLSTNTVKTKYGLVRGIIVRPSPSLVEAYLGIPYASPPVGSLRFMPPITPSTWKNVRNADRFSPVCPQNVPIPPNGPEALLEVPRARLAQLRRLLPLLSNQSEDCLYLNIYVPYENRKYRRVTEHSGDFIDASKLPTILFIHGESYEWNSGNPYDGSELAAHGNVIVVTINFRLGILGFLKTGGKESAQGNFGLMDLVAGLHWLKENLPAFGGDPQQITLLGHGTGAALANILVVSPVASDLIQHTVMVSGSALSPWAIQKNPLFVKRRVAEQTGCHGDMLYYDLAPCLRTKSVAELLAVKIDHPRFLVGFAPFVDGTVISPNTDSIGKLSLPLGSAIVSTSGIEFANFPKRNFIFCLTSVESHLDLNAQDLEFGFNETRRDRILRTFVRNNFHYHLNEIFAVLKNEYTDWDQAIRSPLSSRDATLQFLSDGHTASSLIKLGYMHSLRGGKAYFLHFKHRTIEEEYPQRTGSVRGEDVPFWLGLPISPLFPHNYTTQEKQISRLMLRYLANFAKTGNPNQSSLTLSQPSASSLVDSTPSSSSSSSSSSTANDVSEKFKRSSLNIVNAPSLTSSGPNKSHHIIEDVATAAARKALNLAVLYNQRRTKRTYYKRHSRSNDDHSGSASSEINYFLSNNNNNNNNDNSFGKLDSSVLPFWDAYDVVNQLYMELGSKAEIQSHYRGHKLSMWLNLIPQLHRHANMNDPSMRHHQFQDDLNNLNLYEGIVRAQMQTKPDDDDETLLLPRSRPTSPPIIAQETNATQKPQGGTTECGVDGAMFVAEMTTAPPASENRSLVLDSREKEMATASTGIIANLEVLRRLGGKQFPSYTTALIATVAVGCFLLILNVLIFAGIYHQREKRAKDAKTKEELQDNDTSKNSSMLKLNALGSETGSFNGSGAGVSGKTTVVFGEYSCYDEKSLQTKEEKLIVELPPSQLVDGNWPGCSTSTLDLLKTKHHTTLDNSYALGNIVPINTESQTEQLMTVNNLEMVTYNPLPMATGLIIDPSFAATSSSGLLSKRGSFVGSSGQLNQYDFASVQSSDQMSFKDIENAVKASATMNDDITQDDDIPEPPPPPRSFQSLQQQQQLSATPASASGSGGGGGGILRQSGTTSSTQTGGGKKRVHIQEISV